MPTLWQQWNMNKQLSIISTNKSWCIAQLLGYRHDAAHSQRPKLHIRHWTRKLRDETPVHKLCKNLHIYTTVYTFRVALIPVYKSIHWTKLMKCTQLTDDTATVGVNDISALLCDSLNLTVDDVCSSTINICLTVYVMNMYVNLQSWTKH